ncbi:unnamed protein product [Nyctereutes procyonoides]|uniref:(raccoon dog) hypothetical protein n=1 Tax=Nyctereutes procyonoides TaxID=34880 RepID=A0A811ZM32_NYCPR|nr:unnamed protein product [Nyctereutes procyonoides]
MAGPTGPGLAYPGRAGRGAAAWAPPGTARAPAPRVRQSRLTRGARALGAGIPGAGPRGGGAAHWPARPPVSDPRRSAAPPPQPRTRLRPRGATRGSAARGGARAAAPARRVVALCGPVRWLTADTISHCCSILPELSEENPGGFQMAPEEEGKPVPDPTAPAATCPLLRPPRKRGVGRPPPAAPQPRAALPAARAQVRPPGPPGTVCHVVTSFQKLWLGRGQAPPTRAGRRPLGLCPLHPSSSPGDPWLFLFQTPRLCYCPALRTNGQTGLRLTATPKPEG